MHFRKKFISIFFILSLAVLITGFKFTAAELLIEGPIIDLDEVVKDEPIGGGDSTVADHKEQTSSAETGTSSSESEEESGSLVIDVRKNSVIFNGRMISDYDVIKREAEKNPDSKVLLKDDYADYKTYKSVISYLKKEGISFSEEVVDP